MNPAQSLIALNSKLDRAIELSKIDLGQEYKDCFTAGPIGCSPVRKRWFPTLWVDKDSKIDLPDSGKAVIDYKVTRRSVDIPSDGKERHSISIEVRSIEPGEIAKKKKPLPGTARPIKMSAIHFARARDTDGQFAPQTDDGAPDPNTMAKAYGPGAIAKTSAAGAGAIGAGVLLKKLLKRKPI